MMPNTGRRTESFSSGSDHTNLHHSNGSAALMPPDQNRPRSASSSKALLTMALLEAQSAVQLDNANDISGALDAYQRAVNLLSKVMDTSTSADEQERLRTIHDSYLFRIRLLSTPPTPTSASFAQQPLSTLPQPPPPQQPLPQLPRQPNPRSTGSIPSTLASITPASSSSTISSQQFVDDPDGTSISGSVTQGTLPPTRRTRKHIPVPIHPPPAAGSIIQPPSEPRTPRQRSDSTSTAEHGSPHGITRHHTRSHTGGSTHRMTGDLVHAAEQLHIQAQHRMPGVPKVRSRDHLGVPIYSAPTVPLPPTPSALGQPPSTPPPMPIPSGNGSASSTPTHSNPPTPNMSANHTFMSSLPSSPPPRAPLPPASINLTSPPASPANTSRRVSPLVPSSTPGLHNQQHTSSLQQASQKSIQSPPDSPPEEDKLSESVHSRFYDEDLVADEWLPNLSSTGFSPSEEHSLEDPYPRERVTSKGSYTGSQLEQARLLTTKSTDVEHEGEAPQQKQQQQHSSYQHQRSLSQSSNISAHHSVSSQSKSPLAAPMYSFQQGASSISSLHALDNGSNKRISDSSRSLKESSPLVRNSGVTNGTTGPSSSPSSSSPPVPAPTRPGLQHQYSSSKLSATLSSSNAASPTLDKAWSPSMNNSSQGNGSSGAMTLYDVISDDPFANMSFPLPPPFVEPPPTDSYLRCFWLMRKLEQTMTTGGFLTKRMYVPRAIWYQSLVRLPAADSKMNACQSLNTLFNKMAKQAQNGSLNILVEGGPEGDVDRMTILKELETLETAANQVQSKLSKKLSFIHRPGKNGLNLTIATSQSYSDDMQGPTTGGNASIYGAASMYGDSHNWPAGDEPPLPTSGNQEKSSKKGGVSVGGSASDASAGGLKGQWKSFSKSVQKSIGNDKVEDTSQYTEALVRLFQSSYILEAMLRHYAPSPYQLNIQIANRLRRLCDVLSQVICAFVVRDLGELMGKYVKRIGAWVAD
ncbi:hypothetical protein BGX27_002556 [Mortierella sp. AM989]|nr:hypothetical protein BGX27_002556 [Mortierella sp. AM989]